MRQAFDSKVIFKIKETFSIEKPYKLDKSKPTALISIFLKGIPWILTAILVGVGKRFFVISYKKIRIIFEIKIDKNLFNYPKTPVLLHLGNGKLTF